MRINSDRFDRATRETVTEDLLTALWPVYEKYELHTSDDGHDVYVQAGPWHVREEDKEPPDPGIVRELFPAVRGGCLTTSLGHHYANEPREVYRPLSYPDLFIQFAALPEEGPITVETVLEWADTYGVLGVSDYFNIPAHGGPGETVGRFQMEAADANAALRLYEAATAEEDPHAEALRQWGDALGYAGYTPARLREEALGYVARIVHDNMFVWCYPGPSPRGRGRYVRAYGFKSLLGAMWLQMFWLLTSESAPPRCAWCGSVLYVVPPPGEPAVKKPRSDSRYCRGGACKQAAYRDRKERRSAATVQQPG